MISFADIRVSFLWSGWSAVGWLASEEVFCLLPTLPVPVPSPSLPREIKPVSASWEARRHRWLCPPGFP